MKISADQYSLHSHCAADPLLTVPSPSKWTFLCFRPRRSSFGSEPWRTCCELPSSVISAFRFRDRLEDPQRNATLSDPTQCLTETLYKLTERVWMCLYPNDTHQVKEFNNKAFVHVWNASRLTRVNKLERLPIPSTVWRLCRMKAVNKRQIALLSTRIRGGKKDVS